MGDLAQAGHFGEDQDLLRRIVEGQASAWDEYIEKYGKMLVAWLYQVLRDWDEAADVHMEALEVTLGFGRPSECWDPSRGRSLKNWLWLLAEQRAWKVLRKRRDPKLLPPAAIQSAAGKGLASDSPRAEREPTKLPSPERLRKVFAALTEAEQELLRLKYEDRLTSEQIAAATGSNPGTVRVALMRLRDKLRPLLAEE